MSNCDIPQHVITVARGNYILYPFLNFIEDENGIELPYFAPGSTWSSPIREGGIDSIKHADFTVITTDAVNGNYALELENNTLSTGVYYCPLDEVDSNGHPFTHMYFVLNVIDPPPK